MFEQSSRYCFGLLLLMCCVVNICSGLYFENVELEEELSPCDVLLMLFHRPVEVILTPRGVNRDKQLLVPVAYVPDDLLKLYGAVSSPERLNNRVVIRIPEVPVDIGLFQTLSTLAVNDSYDHNNINHRDVLISFQAFFEAQFGVRELVSVSVWALLNFNTEMVRGALHQAMLGRPDTQRCQLLEITQYYVDLFLDETFFAKASKEMWVYSHVSQRDVIFVNKTGTAETETEDKLWFFRENPSLSLLHYHWHKLHPFWGTKKEIYQDRRGELFCVFHQQLLSRYNANRANLKLPFVKSLDFSKPLKEGYFPKQLNLQTSTCATQRPANLSIQHERILQTKKWMENVETAIRNGQAVTASGGTIHLEGRKGLDMIGNMIEAVPALTPNQLLYGNLHNTLHGIISSAANPHQKYDVAGNIIKSLFSLRDPAFYAIHSTINNVCEAYKGHLKPYTASELQFSAVEVDDVWVKSKGSEELNVLRTFWLETDLDVALGLAYMNPGSLYARFKTMVHEKFNIFIKVHGVSGRAVRGLVRIFLLIQTDHKKQPLDLKTMREWAIELDKFSVTIQPGANLIIRSSYDSVVSIDPDAVYRKASTLEEVVEANHCRCGMPLSLLIPRGTETGELYKLFVMISDGDDQLEPSPNRKCQAGWALCGVPDDRYPDKRSMGFPFDRNFRSDVKKLKDFINKNMATQDVKIKFTDKVQKPSSLLPGGVSTSWKS